MVHAVGKFIMGCYSFEVLVSVACSQMQLGTFTVGTMKVAFTYLAFGVVKRTLFVEFT